MTESEYRSHPALNASRFKAFIRSPFHFKNQVDVEETEQMRIGTAIHTALLEPEKYLSTIAYMPECDRRTKEGKQVAKDFEDANAGKLILKNDSEQIVARSVESVSQHYGWRELKKNQMHRETIIIGELFGIECKAKIDIIDTKERMIWDIKTCQDASREKFRYDVQDRLYWVQQAFYNMLVEKHYEQEFGCGFIAVETTDPSAVGIYTVLKEESQTWKSILERKLEEYKKCTTIEDFHGYEPDSLPALNLKQYIK